MKSCPQCSSTYPEDYAVCPKDGAALLEASLWQVNTVIRGRYKILAQIGEGGMATVYKAHHQLLDELRALKVIKPELARDALFVQRFKNEAIIARKLQHANAVRVDDLDIAEDGRPFISMEFVAGESLKGLIQRSGALGTAKTLDIALQVCDALETAHALGLIHRDIKPDNIVLVPRGEGPPLAKVLDFGIARLKEDAPGGTRFSGMTLTGTGVVIGTPEYMSPEQAMGKHGEQLDGRSDLYSLGIVMYRMLTGELPFKADTTVGMILQHIQTIPTPPQALKPNLGIADDISALIMKALEKDREKRFPSARSMAEAIRRAQEQTVRISPAAIPAAFGARAGGAAPAAQVPQPPAAQARPDRPPSPVRSATPAAIRPAPPAIQRKPGVRPWMIWAGIGVVLAIALIYASKLGRMHEGPAAVQTPAASQPVSPAPGPSTQTPSGEAGAASPAEGSAAAGAKTPAAGAATAPATPHVAAASSPATAPPASGEKEPAGPTPPSAAAQQGQEAAPNSNQQPANPAENTREPLPVNQQKARARQLCESEQYAEASQVLRQILETHPNDQQALRILVNCLRLQGLKLFNAGDYGHAAAAFRQILEIEPDQRWAQVRLQQCREKIREQRQQGSQPQ